MLAMMVPSLVGAVALVFSLYLLTIPEADRGLSSAAHVYLLIGSASLLVIPMVGVMVWRTRHVGDRQRGAQ